MTEGERHEGAPDDPFEIVQLVRRAGRHGGTSGVAFALQQAFDHAGVRNRTVTLQDFGPGARVLQALFRGRVRLLVEVVYFSLAATLWMALRGRNTVVINHGDPVGGEIFVNHGLHRALVARNPAILFRNPLHGFLFLREGWRHAMRAYDVVVCLSGGGTDELRRLHPRTRKAEVVVINNGVDAERFSPRAGYAERLPDVFRLIFVGHEFDRKGLRFVLDALQRLPEHVHLTVVGGSPGQVAAARESAAAGGVLGRVAFLGFRDDVPDLMRRADLFVLPSLSEAWPLVALEAMASGVPVLLSDIVAAPDLVGDGIGGVLIERNGEDIAREVLALLADPSRYLRLRRGAVEKASRYRWSEIARQYLHLCRTVYARRSVDAETPPSSA